MRDYSPKNFNKGRVVKFALESEKWHPVNPGCLGFDAVIKECSHPDHTWVGDMTLTMGRKHFEREFNSGEKWPGTMVGKFDSFRVTTKNVTVSGIALFYSNENLDEIARLEGITLEEIPEAL